MEPTPKLRIVKKRSDADRILVKCEQCGRWTPVDVSINDLVVEIRSFTTRYKAAIG